MKISENIYNLKSDLPPREIRAKLTENTLHKDSPIIVATSKDFIGRVQQNNFLIIDSFFPFGVVCVITGELKGRETSKIILTTSLHKAFRIFFTITAILIGILIAFIFHNFIAKEFLIAVFILLPTIVVFFRLFLHGTYVVARNRVLHKLKVVLELKDSEAVT
jgi:hypothetical protein